MPPFRLFGEKQLPTAVIFMVWSPKRDLIALANKAGELLLHRLANFQRVWSLAPNENTGKEISSVAWRPDGKVLAFSLADTSRVVLCDVEKAEVLHCFPVESPVACMHWMEVSEENSEEKSDEIMKLLDDVRLNILVTGGSGNIIEFYAYGMYKIATSCGVPGTCQGLCLSSDLKSLSLITEIKATTNEREIVYLQYQKLSLTCMCEAWEDILMQMDLKLTKFVQEKNTTTSVQDEFLELLLWGKASGSEALLYHLSELKGMALWKQKYGPIGLDSAKIEAMLRMSEDHVPPELNKMTQKDIAFVADFLSEHFNEAPELYDRKGKYFNVERVGQYLKDEDDDLVSPPNYEGNPWVHFVQNSPHLKGKEKVVTSGLLAIDLGNLLIGNIDDRTDTCCYSCLDARFYDDETLTVVLETAEEDHRERILAQLPLNSVYINEKDFSWDPSQRLDQQSGHIPVQNVVLENQWRALDNMKAHYVAVNGIRRISCVLSSNLRHIRVFEMDVEEEEEDEKQDLQNASADLNQVEESLTSGDGSEVQEDCDTAETPDLQKENDPLLQT
ncbi:APC4 protein, partial [Polypterus senegalus]